MFEFNNCLCLGYQHSPFPNIEVPKCPENCGNRIGIDNGCNNVADGNQGVGGTVQARLLPEQYSDTATRSFRQTVGGQALPSARLVSQRLVSTGATMVSGEHSVHLMQWGQFLTHDIVASPEIVKGFLLGCCEEPHASNNTLCAGIEIHSDDPLYGPYGKTCMNFVRSKVIETSSCDGSETKMEVVNGATSYIDGSTMYGSSVEAMNFLREFSGGRFEMEGDDLLTPATVEECDTDSVTDHLHCFSSGDGRVNEHPGLTLYHTIWLREHNR